MMEGSGGVGVGGGERDSYKKWTGEMCSDSVARKKKVILGTHRIGYLRFPFLLL